MAEIYDFDAEQWVNVPDEQAVALYEQGAVSFNDDGDAFFVDEEFEDIGYYEEEDEEDDELAAAAAVEGIVAATQERQSLAAEVAELRRDFVDMAQEGALRRGYQAARDDAADERLASQIGEIQDGRAAAFAAGVQELESRAGRKLTEAEYNQLAETVPAGEFTTTDVWHSARDLPDADPFRTAAGRAQYLNERAAAEDDIPIGKLPPVGEDDSSSRQERVDLFDQLSQQDA